MRIYLDDDSIETLLVRLLRKAGHDVQVPDDIDCRGDADALHLAHAILDDRLLLSRNQDDYLNLHYLVSAAGGHHPGILIVCSDNDPSRDLTARGIVVAIGNLIKSEVPIGDTVQVLNHWR